MAGNRPSFRIVFNPATVADLRQFEPDVQRDAVAGFVEAARDGRLIGRPVVLGLGVREAFLQGQQQGDRTPTTAATFAVHPLPNGSQVFNILAFAPVGSQGELADLHDVTVNRLRRPGHDLVHAFSPGMMQDLERLKTIGGADYELVWAAINALSTDGTGVFAESGRINATGEALPAPAVPNFDPASGVRLSAHQGADLRGAYSMAFDAPEHLAAGHPARYALVYGPLPPPAGDGFRAVNIVTAGLRAATATYLEAAARIGTLARGLRASETRGSVHSRSNAARRHSTSGSPPQPPIDQRAAAAPRSRSSARGQSQGPHHSR